MEGALTELRQAVEKATAEDRIFRQRVNLRFSQAQRLMSADDRKEIVQMFANRVERAIAAAKPAIIAHASKRFVQANADQHRRAQQSAQRTDVSPGGGPTRPAITNPKYEEAKKAKDVEGMVKSLLG